MAGNTKNYFQQEVNYKIDVRLNDKKNSLAANIEIEYINRSSDTLSDIWIHLWPNAYKDKNSALCRQMLENGDASLYFSKEEERGYIDSLRFTADGEGITLTYDKSNKDIAVLHLSKELLPGNRVILKTPFFVKLPSAKFSRLGYIGQAYAITQWYPKPAVYDRDGWHAMPYLNQGEFYSEYGSFDVTIHLPLNYVVGATGDLQTESEIAFMDAKAVEAKNYSNDMAFPKSSTAFKSIRYTQQNVHDFAWFADKRYYVLKGEVITPHKENKVTTWALFTNAESHLWKNSIQNMNDAIYHYSALVGDYPYKQCTAVDGTIAAGGGMEYPNITIIGKAYDPFTFDLVLAHEIGHNWFYGILGSNERDHPWMDEGMNSFVEMKYAMLKYPPSVYGNLNELGAAGLAGRILGTNQYNYKEAGNFEYQIATGNFSDQAIANKAVDFTYINYGIVAYKKTALAMNYLQDYLGDSIFNACMHSYFDEWKFKHPHPGDLQKVFETVSQKNLDWFFKDFVYSDRSQDLKFKKIKKTASGFDFTVQDKAKLNAPFPVSAYHDSIKFITWYEGSELGKMISFPCEGCAQLMIDEEGSTLDVNRKNNRFPRNHKINVSILPKTHALDNHSLFITPIAGWNRYNEGMLGLSFYNTSLPLRQFEYSISPLYAFGDKTINGIANFKFTFPVRNFFIDKISINNNLRKFSYGEELYRNENLKFVRENVGYVRYSPEITFNIKKSHIRNSISQTIQLQSVHLLEDQVQYTFNQGKASGAIKTENINFYRFKYLLVDRKVVDPYSLKFQTEANTDFAKADVEFKYRISYKMKGKGADIRIYAGKMFHDNLNGLYGYFLSDRNGVRGSNDYAYDELYFGRSETEFFLFQQMALRQGAFKIYTPFGAYKDWIFSANISIDLPIPLPLKLYADLGTTDEFKDDIKAVYDISSNFSYNAGICFSLVKNTIEVYFPLIKSEEIKKYLDNKDSKYSEQIRFVFNLYNLNPLNLRNQLF